MDFGHISEYCSTPCVHVQGTLRAVLRSRRSARYKAATPVEQWATQNFAAGAGLIVSGMCVHAQATPLAFWSSRRCVSWQAGMWLQQWAT